MAVISYVTCDECNPEGDPKKRWIPGYETSAFEGWVTDALDVGWLWRVVDSKTKHICPACQKKER